MNGGTWVFSFKLFEQCDQRLLLGLCTSVLRSFTVLSNSADVAHPNGMRILAYRMSTCAVFISAFVHRAIQIDHVVIPYTFPAPTSVPVINFLNCHPSPLWSRSAMNYYLVYVSHDALVYLRYFPLWQRL